MFKPDYNLIKYSDDDGYTWAPCKDASITRIPRPFYEPKLEDLKKAPEERKPPESILLWPSTPVPGPILLPYTSGIAAIGVEEWQVHDGQKWLPRQKVPFAPAVATILDKDHIFLANTHYRAGEQGAGGDLICARYVNGQWRKETLEGERVVDATLTACRGSGKAVFCFYAKRAGNDDKPTNEVRYRRWANGQWGASQLVAAEAFQVNHVTAPIVCPPDYAAVWWDQRKTKAMRHKASALRFARIPNP
jgi:hypothetical protein